MKYAFKDKQLDCIQNFTFLKNDLDHFWKEYLTLYMNFRAHIESLGFLFSVSIYYYNNSVCGLMITKSKINKL